MPVKVTGAAIGDTADRRHERLAERLKKKFHRDNAVAGDKVHYTVAGKDNPRLQAFNSVMKKRALRKVN